MAITLMRWEAFVQAPSEAPLPDGRNVALELAAQPTIHEEFMLIRRRPLARIVCDVSGDEAVAGHSGWSKEITGMTVPVTTLSLRWIT